MEIRRATMDDALEVLEWRNDPQTVAVSKTGAVSVTDHLAWFARSIDNPARDYFIAHADGRRIGMVRFDLSGDAWLVSINIAPDERGKGYGERVLRQAMAEVGSRRFVAEIKADNAASIRIFERCGFRQVGSADGFLHFERPTADTL
jgi:RimJ/RimL family protein N-acetyltransferase